MTPVPNMPTISWPEGAGRLLLYCQKVLPAVYDDSMTYYEVLCKVQKLINDLAKEVDSLNQNGQEIYDYLQQLHDLLVNWMEHGFDDYYKDQVVKWIDDHLTWIFTSVVRQVYFGLTLEGYFVAYIPEGWSDIVFDTGAVYGTKEYGRLILLYNVNGVDWDDSTGNWNLPYLSELESRVENLELNVGINNETLYTGLAPDGRISLPPTGERIENPLG